MDLHQFGADDRGFTAQQNASDQHGLNVQFPANRARVDLAALVTENRAARHHADARKPREGINDAFRDAVAEIFGLGIGGCVLKRQDSQRVVGVGRRNSLGRGRGSSVGAMKR